MLNIRLRKIVCPHGSEDGIDIPCGRRACHPIVGDIAQRRHDVSVCGHHHNGFGQIGRAELGLRFRAVQGVQFRMAEWRHDAEHALQSISDDIRRRAYRQRIPRQLTDAIRTLTDALLLQHIEVHIAAIEEGFSAIIICHAYTTRFVLVRQIILLKCHIEKQ